MQDTIVTNPILGTSTIVTKGPFTIIHSKDENECFKVDPNRISLVAGQIIEFKAEGASFKIKLIENGYTFDPDEFELDPDKPVNVKVLSASEFDLTIQGNCYKCNPSLNTDGQKKIVVKYAGETIDERLSKRFSDILKDIENLNTKVGGIIR